VEFILKVDSDTLVNRQWFDLKTDYQGYLNDKGYRWGCCTLQSKKSIQAKMKFCRQYPTIFNGVCRAKNGAEDKIHSDLNRRLVGEISENETNPVFVTFSFSDTFNPLILKSDFAALISPKAHLAKYGSLDRLVSEMKKYVTN
jgi:hypothetical protein